MEQLLDSRMKHMPRPSGLNELPEWKILLELIRDLSYLQSESEDFTLASGRTSKHFFDMKPLMMHPEGSKLLSDLLNIRLDQLAPQFVGGLELGAVPLTAIAITGAGINSSRLGFMVRKNDKGRGGRKNKNPPGIEGSSLMKGGEVVILEDVTTTGGSAIKAVERINSNTPCNVIAVLAILDREEGGAEAFLDAGIHFESLYTLSDVAN